MGHFSSSCVPWGQALVYPGAFDGLMIFMSQHCHFRSVISSSGKDDKFVINFVYGGQNEMVDPQNEWSLEQYRETRHIRDLVSPNLALIRMKVSLKTTKSTYFLPSPRFM